MVPSRKASLLLGVHANTLRTWANEGKIKFIRTPSGQRLYDVESFIGRSADRRKILYCRVSSRSQKTDLESQVKYLRDRYPPYEFIEDIGSGLNFKRKGLNALLDDLFRGAIAEIVVTHQDRLARFGFDLIESIASKHNCKIVVLNESKLSPQQELVDDLLSIIHVFSCRLYGLRKYSRKIKEDPDLPQKSNSNKV